MPFIPLWLYYSLLERDFVYFSKVNNRVKFGGLFQYSKYSILKFIPETHAVKSHVFAEKPADADFWVGKLALPFIYKPDSGERGRGVRLIKSESEFEQLFPNIDEQFILQEYCDYPIELGILCCKTSGGKLEIHSVVKKEFLAVEGNGKDTLKKLASTNLRATGRMSFLAEKFGQKWNSVPKQGERIVLEEIGNHCRGTEFVDACEIINDRLKEVFDKIICHVPDFHYGRFDLKVPSLEDLYLGKNIRIFELNGINSEATHIYDKRHNLFFAYRTVYREFKTVRKLSQLLKKEGVKSDDKGIELLRAVARQIGILERYSKFKN